MSFEEYQELAMRTCGQTNFYDMIVNAGLSLSEESGEVAGHIKKFLFHGHDIERDKIIKELGDIMWYIAEMALALDTTMEEVATLNIEKLKKRYPAGFDAERSKNRKELGVE